MSGAHSPPLGPAAPCLTRSQEIWLLLLAAAVSVIHCAPFVVIPKLGDNPGYTSLALDVGEVGFDETATYAPQVRRVFDGRLIVRDATVFEHRDDNSPQPRLPPLVFGLAARLIGGVPAIFVVGKFVVPALAFVLGFGLTWVGSRQFWSSAAAGLGVLFAPFLASLWPPVTLNGLSAFMRELEHARASVSGLPFSRLLTPGLPLALYLAAMLLLALALQRRSLPLALLAGGVNGLLFSCDFYVASSSVISTTLLLLYFVVSRQWASAKLSAAALAALAVTAVPYVVQAWGVRRTPELVDFFMRVGLQHTRAVASWSYLAKALTTLAFAILVAGPGLEVLLPAAMLAAGVAGMYSNLITGVSLQPSHFGDRVVDPASAMLWVVVLVAIARRIIAWWRGPAAGRQAASGLALALAMGALAFGAWNQAKFIALRYQDYALPQDWLETFRWIEAHVPAESVIMSATPSVNLLLPAHTRSYVYFPAANDTIAPDAELVQRLVTTYRFLGIHRDILERFLDGRGPPPWPNSDGPWVLSHHRYVPFGREGPLPPEVKQQVLRAYDELQLTPATLGRYRLNYLWYGEGERELGRLPEGIPASLRLVYQRANVALYEIAADGSPVR